MTIEALSIVPLVGDMEEMPFPDAPYYVIAKDGLYLRKNTHAGLVTIKQPKGYLPSHLDEADIKIATLAMSMPKIPKRTLEIAYGFFKHVYREQKTEAELLFIYNDQLDKYKLFCPHQEVSGASVHSLYDPGDIPRGYQVVGSIHSHCNFSAFHSGTDTADASEFNGVHITMGFVDNDDGPEFDSMIMINTIQWDFDLNRITEIDEDTKLRAGKFPKTWMKYFGKRNEIVLRDFKTLQQEDLDEWKNSFGFVQTIKPQNSKIKTYFDRGDPDWGDDWGEDYAWHGHGYQYGNQFQGGLSAGFTKRYNWQIRSYVPVEWMDSKGDLKPEHIKEAFEQELDTLFDKLADKGFWLAYKIIPMTDDDKDRIEGFDPKDDPRALLPGPFAVMDDDEIIPSAKDED